MTEQSSYEQREAEIRRNEKLLEQDMSEFERQLRLLPPEKQAAMADSAMNNFYCSMPGGLKRRLSPETLGRKLKELRGVGERDKYTSSARHEQTGYEFFLAIDEVLSECDFDIATLEQETEQAGNSADDRAKLHLKLFPVYQKLRKKGYSHHDLIR